MIKQSLWLSFASAAVLVLASCASNKNDWEIADTGPFDEDGNYRDDWADDPTKWRRPGGGRSKPADTRVVKNDQPPSSAVPLPPSSPRTTSTPPKPKPKVASKPKPKPKPVATRYTVKKGDSLYAIALRNKTTVSALQKANGISGSLIRPGQSLVIPRR